jgi:hypothetical protein
VTGGLHFLWAKVQRAPILKWCPVRTAFGGLFEGLHTMLTAPAAASDWPRPRLAGFYHPIDDEVLTTAGITDLNGYRHAPGDDELQLDIFL